jgi:tRNA pseudouridine55 synthase
MPGILNLNKPSGMTSRQAVNVIDRLSRPERSGHAGTLDPLASGVLLVCMGTATRLVEYLQDMPKSYEGTFLLGRSSTTDDTEGEVTELVDPPRPSHTDMAAAARNFIGPIQQRPPAFSAIKVAGRRAYDLARRGQPPELAARTVTVYELDLVEYDYPRLVLRVACSGGTYIRALGRDLAVALGTAAAMSALVRTAIGPFTLAAAVDPTALTPENWTEHVQPMSRAVTQLPQLVLDDDAIARLRHGQRVPCPALPSGEELAVLDGRGQLAAIVRPEGGDVVRPVKNFE